MQRILYFTIDTTLCSTTKDFTMEELYMFNHINKLSTKWVDLMMSRLSDGHFALRKDKFRLVNSLNKREQEQLNIFFIMICKKR